MRTHRACAGKRSANPAILRITATLSLFFLLAGMPACTKREAHLFGRAEEAQRVGSYPEAVQLYNSYLQKYPNGQFSEKSLYNLGNIYYLNLRESNKARETYQKFLDRYPTSQYAFNVGERMGQLYERDLEDYAKAIEILEQVSLRTPSHQDWRRVRYEVAQDYFRLDQFDQAIVEFNKIIQDQPDDQRSDEARIELAAIYEIRQQWREAIAQLQQVIDRSHCDQCLRHAQFEIVDCYGSLKRYDQAIAALKQIPDAPADHAYLVRRLNELEEMKSERRPREVDWSHRTLSSRKRKAAKGAP
ncbi:MAG: tetratricopeptide repeat protein [Acidobacteriia bacterium]|nr:tetratricopeptide repeat protein [Terriglobia bacterium]